MPIAIKRPNPWQESPSPEELILYRTTVSELNEIAVSELISDFVHFIRRRDAAGIYSLFSLKSEATLYFKSRDGIAPKVLSQSDTCASFRTFAEESNTDRYEMSIIDMTRTSRDEYIVRVRIENFGNEGIEAIYGPNAECTIVVGLFESVPVIEKLEMHDTSA